MAHTTPDTRQTQMQIDPKDRPHYSKDQIQTYFKRIHLPDKYLDSQVLSDPALAKTKEHGLPFVQALVRYHVCNVPFENLELHYSAHKKITLNMDDLYEKFAERGLKYGRGGRCMEQNGFFGTVLRSLGFDVRNCAGRVSRMMSPNAETREKQGQTYDGWNHMLNLVRFDKDEWWVVDVGMGVFGANKPMQLKDGYEDESVAPRRVRLQYRSIAEHAAERDEEAQKLWCFDCCFDPSASPQQWIPTYCFTETEFLPQDYEMMSWYTSTHPRSFFTYSVLCMRMRMDEAGEKIIGDYTMAGDRIRKTEGPMLGGEKEVVKELHTEKDRIEGLKEIFGVELTDEEREGIRPDLQLK
jgi:arylamine N-acetyltransferase